MELKRINMDRIVLSKSKIYFEEGEVFLLAKSIALAGLLSPITVVPLAHSDRYEIVTGNKRFYACRMLRFKEINAIVIKANPYFARAALKKGDYCDFFAEADGVYEAITKTGLSVDELSNLTGYTKSELQGFLKLSTMSELEREIVKKNNISKDIAIETASFDDIRTRNSILSEAAKRKAKIEKRRPLAHRTPKFKDLRLFDNTLIKALQILKESGVETELNTEKTPSATEYKIKIHS